MKFLITFGPTDEPIDAVRAIVNKSSGALGAVIAYALAYEILGEGNELFSGSEVWLVGNKKAIKKFRSMRSSVPACVRLVEIDGYKGHGSQTEALQAAIEDVMTEERIDFVLHAAAVADYTPSWVLSQDDLVQMVIDHLRERWDEGLLNCEWEFDPLHNKHFVEYIARLFEDPQGKVQRRDGVSSQRKLSSDESGLIMGLRKTPKIIGKIGGFAEAAGYKTQMISWKLLNGVSEQELYDVALAHGRKNGSWLVVANDLEQIRDGKHPALIIDVASGEVVARPQNKVRIADELVKLMAKKGC